MKPITFADFNNELKNRLGHLIDFFEKEKINYSLAYGTLLGAYRHKDMIPWDSDIDLYIEKKDLAKFIKQARENKKIKISSYLDNEQFYGVTKVYFPDLFIESDGCIGNPWIDLFDFDTVARSKKNLKIALKFKKNKKLYEIKMQKKSSNFVKQIIRKVFCIFIPNLKRMNYMLDKKYKQLDLGSEMMGGYSIKDCISSQVFGQKITFGNYKAVGFKENKKYLEEVYGKNFMVPINDQRGDKRKYYA